jgi:hypothetical protein
MHWLKLLKNNLNQQQFKSKHLQASYLEGRGGSESLAPYPAAAGIYQKVTWFATRNRLLLSRQPERGGRSVIGALRP